MYNLLYIICITNFYSISMDFDLLNEIFETKQEKDILKTLIEKYKQSPSDELIRKYSLELYFVWIKRQNAIMQKLKTTNEDFWKTVLKICELTIERIVKLIKSEAENATELKMLKSVLSLIYNITKEDLFFQKFEELLDYPNAMQYALKGSKYQIKVTDLKADEFLET